MAHLIEGKISARRDWAPGLATLCVDAPIADFSPGQFVNLAVQSSETLIRRAYSLASAPGATPEFFINEIDGGALSPALFRLRVGDSLLVEPKPQGFFTLEWVPTARELWMIATGTGLAPYVSMLRAGRVFDRFERVIVVHGVRRAEELAYATEIAAFADARRGSVTRVPVVSREPGAVGVLHGRITGLLTSGELEQRAGSPLDPERSHVLLCGNPAMIDELTELLAARGLRRHRTRKPGHITTERYWDEAVKPTS